MKEIKEYNEQGLLTYHKNSNGMETWYKYDESGRLRSIKDRSGFEYLNVVK